jgi:hypothetical protein
VFASGSDGASGRVGDYAIAGIGPTLDGAGCPQRRFLFRYPHPDFPLPREPRGLDTGSYSATLRSVRGRLQVRTVEGLYSRRDAGCCPSYTRTSEWRLEASGARFVRVQSRLRRAPRPRR